MLQRCSFVAVATQDDRLIAHVRDVTERDAIPRERYQFQMLYGVRPQLQLDLARAGYSVLVATPYGPDWYPYLMRRLAERPANLLFVAKSMLKR
jgi:proline dehydrogenase